MKNLFSILSVIVISLSLCGAKVYQWTDEDGTVHFSRTPPPEVMKKADIVNINTGEGDNYTIEDLVNERWYANDRGQVIELLINKNIYRWKSSQNGRKTVFETGSWQMFPEQIEFTPENGGLVRKFVVRNQRANSVTLINVETEKAIDFRKLDKSYRELNEKEQQMSGVWTEVNSNEMPIGYATFDSGVFRRFRMDGRLNSDGTPNANHVIAEGNWSVRGSLLLLEYVNASTHLSDRTAQVEEWDINQLDYRNLIVKNINSNEKMHFKRKRTE